MEICFPVDHAGTLPMIIMLHKVLLYKSAMQETLSNNYAARYKSGISNLKPEISYGLLL